MCIRGVCARKFTVLRAAHTRASFLTRYVKENFPLNRRAPARTRDSATRRHECMHRALTDALSRAHTYIYTYTRARTQTVIRQGTLKGESTRTCKELHPLAGVRDAGVQIYGETGGVTRICTK